MAYEAETPRLYLERLSIDKHFEDFWEMWTDPRSMVWSSVSPLILSNIYIFFYLLRAHIETQLANRKLGLKLPNALQRKQRTGCSFSFQMRKILI